MQRAMTEDGLWQRLVDGIAPQPSLDDCARTHLALFDRLRFAVAA